MAALRFCDVKKSGKSAYSGHSRKLALCPLSLTFVRLYLLTLVVDPRSCTKNIQPRSRHGFQ